MNDPQPVAVLRTRSRGVLAELFDTYGDRLFGYCWYMLRNRETAQIALRNTLIVAQPNMMRLADPGSAGAWLYSLARAECRRRRPVPAAEADEPPARPGQHDAGPRLTAWNTVMSLEPDEREALDLACRHDVDVALVLGRPAEQVQALLGRARHSLERALSAEIVISRGIPACPDRAQVMEGWAGLMTPQIRERTLRHAVSCPVCGPALPRNVSPARVFALLPSPVLSPSGREEVLRFLGDPRLAAYREFAISRAPELTESGFPVPPRSLPDVPAGNMPPRSLPDVPLPGRRRARLPRGRALLAGAAAAGIAFGCVLVGARGAPGPVPGAAGGASVAMAASPSGSPVARRPGREPARALPVGARRPQAQLSAPPPFPGPAGDRGEAVITAVTRPLPAGPQRALPGPAGTLGRLAVTPDSLALGTGFTGQVSVTAVGGPVSWAAAASVAQVVLSSYSGTLRAGQSSTLIVGVSRAAGNGGIAVVTLRGGSFARTILVSWDARSAQEGHSVPSSSPSSSDSASSASPSPSAHAS